MLERPLSSSSIKTYLQCMLKYYFRYENKKPRSGKSDPLAFGIAVHEALEHMHSVVSRTGEAPTQAVYDDVMSVFMLSATKHGLTDMPTYQEGKDMLVSRLDSVDPKQKILGLELRFELKTPKGTPFTGSIDKLIELDEETIVIVDYKTSRMALSQEEADTDIQLSMYDLAVSMMFPKYKTILCGLDYLRLSDVVSHRTLEQRKLFVEFLDAIYENICSADSKDIVANLNEFCPWCEVKGFCTEYKRMATDPELVLPMIGESTDREFVESWAVVSSAKRIIDARQREFKAEIYKRMSRADVIKGKDNEIYKTQSSRMNYDAKTVYDVMGPDRFLKGASIGKRTVDKFLQDHPEHIDQVEKTASFSFMSPSFRTRKSKEK